MRKWIHRKKIRSVIMIAVMLLGLSGCRQIASSEVMTVDFSDESTLEEFILEDDSPVREVYLDESTEEEKTAEEIYSAGVEENDTISEYLVEYVYELSPDQNSYYVWLESDILKEDGHYVIAGEMCYAGTIVITWQQKELLDAGEAVLIVMYQGNEVDRIVRGDIWTEPSSPDSGFYLGSAEQHPGAPEYQIVLNEEFRMEIPGDTVIEPDYFLGYTYSSETEIDTYEKLKSQTWTVERYYEEVILQEKARGPLLFVYAEEGKVIKIIESYLP